LGRLSKVPVKRLSQPQLKSTRQVAKLVRARIEAGGERLWRLEDFDDQPFSAVARTLSRLASAGIIQRLSKGTYYRSKPTAFGQSRPNPTAVQNLAGRKKALFPAGTAAANLLGFTTQTARRNELATSAASLPRKLVGAETQIHTRRPEAWASLTQTEAAMLDFIRRGGKASELPPEVTVRRTLDLLRKADTYSHLMRIAMTEPPRVRAILGALGENLRADAKALNRLRRSLNPLSKFDFGLFAVMPNAKTWQAKGRG
jgi:hypothetical protein